MNIFERLFNGLYCITGNKRIEVKRIFSKGFTFDYYFEITIRRLDLKNDNVVIHYNESFSLTLKMMKANKKLTSWKNLIPNRELKKAENMQQQKEIVNELTDILNF